MQTPEDWLWLLGHSAFRLRLFALSKPRWPKAREGRPRRASPRDNQTPGPEPRSICRAPNSFARARHSALVAGFQSDCRANKLEPSSTAAILGPEAAKPGRMEINRRYPGRCGHWSSSDQNQERHGTNKGQTGTWPGLVCTLLNSSYSTSSESRSCLSAHEPCVHLYGFALCRWRGLSYLSSAKYGLCSSHLGRRKGRRSYSPFTAKSRWQRIGSKCFPGLQLLLACGELP